MDVLVQQHTSAVVKDSGTFVSEGDGGGGLVGVLRGREGARPGLAAPSGSFPHAGAGELASRD